VQDGGGQLSVVLIGHPRLKLDLRRPIMEEIGDRATALDFGGLRDRQPLRGDLDPVRSNDLTDKTRAAGLPV
jgi:type II secretory pathway predicted ATPase ExeA